MRNPEVIKRETNLVKAMVHAQLSGKVETPKTEPKSKFRPAKHPEKACAPGTARELSKSAAFADICERAGCKPTKRQASKYLRGFGTAFAKARS